MKLSVSLPEEDVEFLDQYAKEQGTGSRSAALHEAINRLRDTMLDGAYAQAFAEWDASEDGELWDAVSGDGVTADAPR